MTIWILILLVVSVAFNYYQKRDRNKTLRLLAAKNQNIMLAIRAGNIAVGGYDVKKGVLYNIEGEVFPKSEVTIEEAMAGVHPDDVEEFASILQGVVAGIMPNETICIRFLNPFTNEWEYVEKEFAVIKSRSGEVHTVIGTHKDVTKRVLEAEKTDELLKNYQQLYNENQTILNTLPVGMVLYDKNGILLHMNHTMCDILGVYDLEKLLSAKPTLWDNAYMSDEMKQKFAKGENTAFDYQVDCNTLSPAYYLPIDKTLYIACVSNVIRNEAGEVESYIFIHRDITLQEMQEREIQEMSETLIHVIDASGFSVWEYPIKDRKFYSYRGDLCVEDGTSYEDTLAKHTPASAALCNTIFEHMMNGITEIEHAVFELQDSEHGEITYYKCELVARKDEDGKVVKIYGVQKDITDEHNYQLELEESKLKTQLAIHVSDMVQWEYDVDRHIFYNINKTWESEEMTFTDYCEVAHPDDLPKMIETIQLMDSQRNETFQFDVRFKHPTENKWQHMAINGTPLKQDKNGAVIKYTGFQRNNTQWHNLTEELKRKDEMNELILNNISSGLVYLAADRTVIWENTSKKFTVDFTGGLPLFEVGKACHETHMGMTKECETYLLQDIWENKDFSTVERTLNNGKVLEITGSSVVDDSGNPVGTILRVDDITQKKETIKKLRATEQKASAANQLLSTILDNLPSSIFVKDANDDYKYLTANKKFSQGLGLVENDIIGKTDYDIFPVEEANRSRRDDIDTVENNHTKIINGEKVTMKDGVVVWYTVKTPLINIDNNNQRLLIGIGVDITENHNAYQELAVAKMKAEESDKLKSAFLANMSHEIRTPLNAIVGFSELMQTCDDEADKEEYMRIIMANNELLLRLINDILDLSKLESGIVQFHNSTFDLVECFDELAATMRQRITNPNIEFIAVNPYKSCIIETDKTRMTQVWHNFMTNAIKYTISGHIKMGYEYVNEGIKIYVEDTGIGIPEEKKGKLFKRFEKLDSFAQGTGLGLSICKAITELNGGEIGCDSTEGKGSIFWSWKPLKAQVVYKSSQEDVSCLPQETATKDVDIESYMMERHCRILVAEDNDSNYLLISHILKNNFRLSRVMNGSEAVEFVRNNQVDLILMDMKMPVMGGLEATRSIREFNQDIPIIALTANVFDSDRSEALGCGCNDFLSKPVRQKDLLETIFRFAKNSEKKQK